MQWNCLHCVSNDTFTFISSLLYSTTRKSDWLCSTNLLEFFAVPFHANIAPKCKQSSTPYHNSKTEEQDFRSNSSEKFERLRRHLLLMQRFRLAQSISGCSEPQCCPPFYNKVSFCLACQNVSARPRPLFILPEFL